MPLAPISGTTGNDKKIGTAANEIFFGLDGNDDFDGGGGTDTAGFNDVRADFDISTVNGVTQVKHRDNKETTWDGNDKYTNVERLHFSDQTVFLVGNRGPDAGTHSGVVTEDATNNKATGDVAAAEDSEGDTLAVSQASQGTHRGNYGTLVLNADGTYEYTLDNTNATVNGLNTGSTPLVDSFSFTVTDFGFGGRQQDTSGTSALNITINGNNDAPVGKDDTATVLEEGTAEIDVLANDTDVDNATLSIKAGSVSVVNPAHGTAVIKNGKIEFTGAKDFAGEATINYAATDGDKESNAQAKVTVTNVNDAPVNLRDVDTATANEVRENLAAGAYTGIQLKADDVDDAAADVSYFIKTADGLVADDGTFKIGSDNKVLTSKLLDYEGGPKSYTITTVARDKVGALSNEVQHTINVTDDPSDNNRAPEAKGETFSTSQNDPFTSDLTNRVTANDSDPDGDPITVTGFKMLSDLRGAYFNLAADGTLSFKPEGKFNYLGVGQTEDLKFQYAVQDNKGVVSNTVESIMQVVGRNDNPFLANAIPDLTAKEGQVFNYTFPANTFADPDVGDTLTYVASKSDFTPLPSLTKSL